MKVGKSGVVFDQACTYSKEEAGAALGVEGPQAEGHQGC